MTLTAPPGSVLVGRLQAATPQVVTRVVHVSTPRHGWAIPVAVWSVVITMLLMAATHPAGAVRMCRDAINEARGGVR